MAKKPTPKPPAKKKAVKAKPKAIPKPKPTPEPVSRIVVGDFELGQHYGVDKKSIYNWRKDGMPGKKLPGNKWEYDLDQTDEWVEARRLDGEGDDELKAIKRQTAEAKMRIANAEAEDRERKNELAEGNVLERDRWELFAAETIQTARDAILRVPSFFHNHLCKKCQHKISELRDQLEKALTDLGKLRDGPADED